MYKNFTFFLLLGTAFTLLAGCNGQHKPILQKWQAVTIDDELMNQLMKEQSAFLDTMGNNTTALENMELYMTGNVDSLKEVLRLNLTEAENKHKEKVAQLWYHFMPDSLLVMHSRSGLDTAKWHFDNETTLVLDAPSMNGSGSLVKLEIVQLEDTVLKLRNMLGNNSVTTVMRPKNN